MWLRIPDHKPVLRVQADLRWLPEQRHSGFVRRSACFPVVARKTGTNQVFP